MSQLEQNIIKGLDDQVIARVYNRKRKAVNKAATITERLAVILAKLTGILYFGFLCFCLGYFSTLYFDGLLFEIPGLLSYWVDFGSAQ
jgi:hypothetical protein